MRQSKPSHEAEHYVGEYFAAIGEPMRLRILTSLGTNEKSVSRIVKELETSQPNVSKHLKVLWQMGFVVRRNEGTYSYYRLADDTVLKLISAVRKRMAIRAERQRDLLSPCLNRFDDH